MAGTTNGLKPLNAAALQYSDQVLILSSALVASFHCYNLHITLSVVCETALGLHTAGASQATHWLALLHSWTRQPTSSPMWAVAAV